MNLPSLSISSLKSAATDAVAWWRGLVAEAIPGQYRHKWSVEPVEIEIQHDEKAGRTVALEDGVQVPVDAAYLGGMAAKWGMLAAVTVRVPLSSCFVRDIAIPRAAQSRAAEIVELDLERTTPFPRQEVLSGWFIPDDQPDPSNLNVRQVVLKRNRLADLLERIATAGLPVKSVQPVATDGTVLPVNLLTPAESKPAPASRLTARLAVAVVAIAGLLLTAGTISKIINLEAALADAEEQVQKATSETQAIRKKMTDARAESALIRMPRTRKLGTVPIVAIIEELTQILPQGTWLTDLRIEDINGQIDGHSTNASELITLLARSPLFSNVTFASPVTRDQQRNIERFQIRFQVAGRAAPVAEAPAKGDK